MYTWYVTFPKGLITFNCILITDWDNFKYPIVNKKYVENKW